MPDMEKVIKALELCSMKYECCTVSPTVKCPYDEFLGTCEDLCDKCTTMLAKDALALLKEQKPITPHKNLYTPVIPIKCSYECECTAPLIDGQPFCARCGRKVKWE